MGYKRNQKKHDEEFATLDDNLDNSIEELLRTEEEKVGPQVTLSLRHTLTLFFLLIGKVQKVSPQEFHTLRMFVARSF
jgi:hypothetical protein